MKVIGITGGIATGKSTCAAMLNRMGFPVFDADREAKSLMCHDREIFLEIARLFPKAQENGSLNRRKIAEEIYRNLNKKTQLEAIIHPRIRQAEAAFIRLAHKASSRAIVLDIPLLYESGADALCDTVWVTDCPAFLQRQRALKRPGMTAVLLSQIIQSQLGQTEKKRRADRVIPTGAGKSLAQHCLIRFLQEELCEKSA